MNALIKIFLLTVGVVGAVFGILFFQKTIAQPPAELDMPDQFVPSVREDISKINDAVGFDTLYVSITSSIKSLTDNELITPEVARQLTYELYVAYVPVFCERSKRYFCQSEWSKSKLDRIRSHSKLLSYEAQGLDPVLPSEMRVDLLTLRNVVRDYYEAWSVANVGPFRSLEYSKSKIIAAKNSLDKDYITNCARLKTKLENVPKTLSDKHYDFLVSQVDELSSYRQLSPKEFTSRYNDVIRQIDEYDSSRAKEIYGTSEVMSTTSLRDEARKWERKANWDQDWLNQYSRR